MDINEFNDKLNEIRARNGWRIELECSGIWVVRIRDKETDKLLASTGTTGLGALLYILELPFDNPVWHNYTEGDNNES